MIAENAATKRLAYQMNRPKEKDGIIVAFRRKENEENSIRVQLSGLEKIVYLIKKGHVLITHVSLRGK